jgi:hypothetical protein
MAGFLLYGDTMHGYFQNFQHLMDENICLLGDYINKGMSCKILVPDTIGPSGIPYYSSILKEVIDVLRLNEKVEIVKGPIDPITTEPMWQVTPNKVIFYRHFKNSLPHFESGPKKIFIKRTWGTKQGEIHGHPVPIRRIVNEDEIQLYLEEKGFVTVTFDGITFAEKKKLLQNAEEVITQTGANCINLFLCDKLQKLTLLTNDVFRMGGYFIQLWSYIHQRNIQCSEIPFESIDRHLLTEPRGAPNGEDNGNFYVNPEQLC